MRDNLFHLKEKIHDWGRRIGIKTIAVETDSNAQTVANSLNEYCQNKLDVYSLIEMMEALKDLSPLDLIETHFNRVGVSLDFCMESEESIVRSMAESMASLGEIGMKIENAMLPDSNITKKEWNEIIHLAFKHAKNVFNFIYALHRRYLKKEK